MVHSCDTGGSTLGSSHDTGRVASKREAAQQNYPDVKVLFGLHWFSQFFSAVAFLRRFRLDFLDCCFLRLCCSFFVMRVMFSRAQRTLVLVTAWSLVTSFPCLKHRATFSSMSTLDNFGCEHVHADATHHLGRVAVTVLQWCMCKMPSTVVAFTTWFAAAQTLCRSHDLSNLPAVFRTVSATACARRLTIWPRLAILVSAFSPTVPVLIEGFGLRGHVRRSTVATTLLVGAQKSHAGLEGCRNLCAGCN